MQRSIVGLDLIRFAAAIIVSIFHLFYWISIDAQPGYIASGGVFRFPASPSRTWFGWVGVEIFFVVSGFVIVYSAERANWRDFLKSRVLRLFPAALICATLTLVAVLCSRSATLTNGLVHTTPHEAMIMWLKSLVFFPVGPWIDAVYWTLPIEMSFYITVFLCLLTNRIKWLPALMILLGVLSTLWNAAVWFRLIGNSNFENRLGEILLWRHGCEFAIGVLLWRAIFRRWNVIDCFAILIFLIGGSIEIALRAEWGMFVAPIPSEQPVIIPITIWLASVGAIAASGLFHRNVMINPRVAALTRTMGITTYPFYLLHAFIGSLLMKVLFDLGISPFICALVALITLIVAAVLVSSLLEPLVRSAMMRLMGFCKNTIPARKPSSAPAYGMTPQVNQEHRATPLSDHPPSAQLLSLDLL